MVLTETQQPIPTGFRPDGRPNGTISDYLAVLAAQEQSVARYGNPHGVSVEALVKSPKVLFNWFTTTPSFRTLYQQAMTTFFFPYSKEELDDLRALLAGGLNQEVAFAYLTEVLRRKNPAVTLLSPERTFSLYRRLFPKAEEEQFSPFKPPSLEGVVVPDGLVVEGNMVVSAYEYTIRRKQGKSQDRSYGLFKDVDHFPSIFSPQTQLVFVGPRASDGPRRSHRVGFLSMPYDPWEFGSFARFIWAGYRSHQSDGEESATLREIQNRAVFQFSRAENALQTGMGFDRCHGDYIQKAHAWSELARKIASQRG